MSIHTILPSRGPILGLCDWFGLYSRLSNTSFYPLILTKLMVLSETLSCPTDLRALAEVNISPGRKQVATWLCRRLALSASTVLLGNFWGFFQTHFAGSH